MRNAKFLFCLIAIYLCGISGLDSAVAMQSLADAARREAARRDRLERLGIEGKVIEGNGEGTPPEGNVSTLTPSEANPEEKIRTSPVSSNRSTLRRYRTKLQKLDKDIRKGDARLEKLQDRLESLRRKSFGIGNFKGISRNRESRDRVWEQIEDLQVDLKLLKKERREVYDAGRKDGFMPGELDGKGIIP